MPGDYPTIQAAINAANIGDTIKVASGTYNENVNLKSGICLEGAGIDQTVISKNGASGLMGSDLVYVIVKNLTISGSGGIGVDGGGIDLVGSNNITLQSCRSTGNSAANGGGLLISGGNVTVNHFLIDNNSAQNIGGGIVIEGSATASLTNVTVADNTWTNSLGNGGVGGVRIYGSGTQISQSIIWGNTGQNIIAGGASISNSDIGGWSGGTNNISSDPHFSSPSDFHLQAGSPASGMGVY